MIVKLILGAAEAAAASNGALEELHRLVLESAGHLDELAKGVICLWEGVCERETHTHTDTHTHQTHTPDTHTHTHTVWKRKR